MLTAQGEVSAHSKGQPSVRSIDGNHVISTKPRPPKRPRGCRSAFVYGLGSMPLFKSGTSWSRCDVESQVDSCVVGMSQRRSGKHQGGSGLAELSNGKFAIERPWRRRAASTPNMLYHCSRDESQKRCAQSGAILNIRRSKWSFMHTACVLRAVSRTDESDGTRQRRKIATTETK